MPMLPLVLSPLVLSSDSHVFEPPDLWQTRIDRAFRDRAPRIERISGGDYVVVETDQILSGIGLISYAVFCLKKKKKKRTDIYHNAKSNTSNLRTRTQIN